MASGEGTGLDQRAADIIEEAARRLLEETPGVEVVRAESAETTVLIGGRGSGRRMLPGARVRILGWGPSLHNVGFGVRIPNVRRESGCEAMNDMARRDPGALYAHATAWLGKAHRIQDWRAAEAARLSGPGTLPYDPGMRSEGRPAEVAHLLVDEALLHDMDERHGAREAREAIGRAVASVLVGTPTPGASLRGTRYAETVLVPTRSGDGVGAVMRDELFEMHAMLPSAMLSAAVGRRLGELVELPAHQAAMGERRIVAASASTSGTALKIEPRWVRIGHGTDDEGRRG